MDTGQRPASEVSHQVFTSSFKQNLVEGHVAVEVYRVQLMLAQQNFFLHAAHMHAFRKPSLYQTRCKALQKSL